jgi:glycosyltransferase involved in cell wall biosynthesis
MLKKLSIVIPIFNEADGLSTLFERLDALLLRLNERVQTEILLVDDHSTDGSFDIIKGLLRERPSYSCIRLSRNQGSHVAIIAGFKHAKGDAAVFLAGDLQDPPELIFSMLDKWQEGNDVVWAVRDEHQREGILSKIASRLFYLLLSRMTNLHIPKKGADYALLDRKVYLGLIESAGSKPSLGALISWLGFKQTEVLYIKEKRKFGKSKWTLSKKLSAFADAFVGFSYLPMRIMSFIGAFAAFAGFLYAIVIVAMRFMIDDPIEGWASIMVITLILGGMQMLMLGVLGEYIWRNLEESRKRPLYLVEEKIGGSEL